MLRAAGHTELADAVTEAIARLDEPMRVAIAGQVSRGKSTLVNALLGQDLLATDRTETTYNVSELHFAPSVQLRVHYRDGRPPQDGHPDDLTRFTIRSDEDTGIRKVEYGLPEPLLKSFRLIDTPGLHSVHQADSWNTERMLGLAPHDDSVGALEQADAVVYLFSRSMHEQDLDIVSDFATRPATAASPVQAIGVLAKCDAAWPPATGDPVAFDPFEDARRVIENDHDRPEVRRLFYTVVPVAGHVARGAHTLDDVAVGRLRELAKATESDLAAQLRTAPRFVGADSPPGPQARKRLHTDLGAWGVFEACRFLRDHAVCDVTDLQDHLWRRSGLAHLHGLMVRHFGNRSGLIKLHQAVHRLDARLSAARSASADPHLDEVLAVLEAVRASEHSFREMAALSHYHWGRLSWPEAEMTDLLNATGENGMHAARRLGMPLDAGLDMLAEQADDRIRHWSIRSNGVMANGEEAEAAHIVLRSYDRIAERIDRARRLLDIQE